MEEQIEQAKRLFANCQELDGNGLVITDEELLAEGIAGLFDVPVEQIYSEGVN